MKALLAAVTSLGVMCSFVGTAIADVSISIRFGSSPSYNSYRSYRSYRSNIYQPTYPSVPYQNNHYDHFDRYNRNINSSVIVPNLYPSSSYYRNSWNYAVPTIIHRSNSFERHYSNHQGDRYIIEKRIIRIR
jgi:hypothetical protein